ncbi:MAG: hypothetical protein AAFQ53_17180 [Bacteroidota bacterium]
MQKRACALLAETGLPVSLEPRSSAGGRYAFLLLDELLEIEIDWDRCLVRV